MLNAHGLWKVIYKCKLFGHNSIQMEANNWTLVLHWTCSPSLLYSILPSLTITLPIEQPRLPILACSPFSLRTFSYIPCWVRSRIMDTRSCMIIYQVLNGQYWLLLLRGKRRGTGWVGVWRYDSRRGAVQMQININSNPNNHQKSRDQQYP